MFIFCVNPLLKGIYFYNSHPVYKVDVLGTVVYRRERDDFFCYGGNPAVWNKVIMLADRSVYRYKSVWLKHWIFQHVKVSLTSPPHQLNSLCLILCFHLFPVDDGTGVINCLCWKNELMKEEEDLGECKFERALMSVFGCVCIGQILCNSFMAPTFSVVWLYVKLCVAPEDAELCRLFQIAPQIKKTKIMCALIEPNMNHSYITVFLCTPPQWIYIWLN